MRIPSQIMDFRVYNDDERLIGTGSEMTLPTITNIAASLDLPGGTIDMPSMRTENIELEVPFRLFGKEAAEAMSLTNTTSLTIRAAKQSSNSTTHNFVYGGVKISAKGYLKECNLGTLKLSDGMDSRIKLTLTYIKVETADPAATSSTAASYTEVLEIDKLNGVYRINGTDVRAGIDAYL